jgi:hypothetical protein
MLIIILSWSSLKYIWSWEDCGGISKIIVGSLPWSSTLFPKRQFPGRYCMSKIHILILWKIYTVILSFLKRERERTVNVPWTFSTIRPKAILCHDSKVPRRSWPFTVPDRSPSLTVHRPWALPWPYLTVP